jgi:hypothetical protein
MFIRHAEKPGDPPCENDDGVQANGEGDKGSLTVRGWQRAGALAKFFSAQQELCPNVIFASKVGEGSKSQRPQETVTPLADLLNLTKPDVLVYTHLKDDVAPLMQDVMTRAGKVLVAWEHSHIPGLVGLLPDPPDVPQKWPDKRFDIVWVFDRAGEGWKFSQVPQLLLKGDSAEPIV